jgi:histidyl-tRNA synthetase
MARIQARVLRGFRDYMPEEMLPRQKMLQIVEQVFLSFGYAPLQTPAMEYSEVLLGKYGAEGDKLLYRFLDNGERDIALRYDLTVPLARVVAQNANLPLPFKRYQIAPVWRAEKPARGRFREFMQCDADIIGASGSAAEVEILSLGERILQRLDVGAFAIRVNHRGVFDGLASLLEIEAPDQKIALVRTLDKLDKIGREKVLEVLANEVGITAGGLEIVSAFLDLPTGDLDAAAAFFSEQNAGAAAVSDLARTVALARETGCGESLLPDLSLARGLNYYTGLIYEASLNALPEYGSVMGGGRYDGLMDIFGAPPHPAVGISLGVDRLYAALSEMKGSESASTATKVLVVVFGDEGFVSASRLAQELRGADFATEVYLQPKTKIGKQFRYADRKGIPFVAIQGSDELETSTVRIKDLQKGEEGVFSFSDAVAWIQARL